MLRTYLLKKRTISEFVREAASLYRLNFSNIERNTIDLANRTRSMLNTIEMQLDRPLENCDILEVGPGQSRPLMYALGKKNRWTGIDIEIPPDSFSIENTLRLYRRNGFERALKTSVRQLSGIDRRRIRALECEFGATGASGKMVEADASAMPFPDSSFDVVISISVFEHLSDPPAVIREIARVLKPGGVAHIVTHLYTSPSGCHDPRLFNDLNALPYWAHLRSHHSDKVSENSYLNKWRAVKFIESFEALWIGSKTKFISKHDELESALNALRNTCELLEYHDDELLHDVLITIWQKHAG